MASSDEEVKLADIPFQLKPLVEGFKALYSSKAHADYTISCKGTKWRVHKLCLCTQSEYFRKGLSVKFREGLEGTIHLDDDDPMIIDILIHYLYNFEYVEFAKERSGLDKLIMDVKMYIIADKYFVASLREAATKNFETHAGAIWNTQAFFDTVRHVYNHFADDYGTNSLKQTIIKIVKEHKAELFSTTNGYSCFLAVLGASSGFGKDVAVALASSSPSGKNYRCPSCRIIFGVDAGVKVWCCPNEACDFNTEAENWVEHEVRR